MNPTLLVRYFFVAVFILVSAACAAKVIVNKELIIERTIDTELSSIRYIERVGAGSAIVVFIHGTPGGAEAFQEYLDQPWLLDKAKRVVSIDRPAWGLSEIKAPDKAVLNLAEQSRVIGALLTQFDNEFTGAPIVIVGHSLGGALVARLLGDYPDVIDAGLILAGPLDESLSRPRFYHKAAKLGLVKMLIGSKLRRSNQEMLMLADDLAASAANYDNISMPITLIQGARDPLVNIKNADTADKYWPQATVLRLENSGHFLPWQQQTLIVEHIGRLIDIVSAE